MKKWLILLLILAGASHLFSQNQDNQTYGQKFSTPGMAKFMHENPFFANPDFKWKSYFYLTFFDVGFQSAPDHLFVTDFFAFGSRYFHTKIFSAYSFEKPYLFKKETDNIGYWLPVGISFPVITGPKYNFSLRCDYYWAIHFSDHSEYSDPENYTQKPSILDFQLQLDFFVKKAISKLNFVCGYRQQLTPWNVVEASVPVYSNDLTGQYVGISWGLGVSSKENYGLTDWEAAKKVNTVSSYDGFLKKYPGSHYEKEANARLEYAAYQAFEKGNLDDCNYYMTRFPSGLFLKEAQSRKAVLVEENLYKNAIAVSSLFACDRYLSTYPNGKYASKVEAEKIKIYAVMKEDSIYNLAKNGELDQCNNYLATYPAGKYIKTVQEKKDKLDREVMKELNAYNKVVSSNDISEMKSYLSGYPNGNHRVNVQQMIEPLLYKAAIEADWYTEYETYLKFCPEGSNIAKITQRLEFLRANKAISSAIFPSSLKGVDSPWSNVSSPVFKWEVTFTEKSGKTGYKVKGSGWYYDNKGDKWGNQSYSWNGQGSATEITTGEIEVKAGGKYTYDTWFSGDNFVGGYILMSFDGKDAGGNPINIMVKINCK